MKRNKGCNSVLIVEDDHPIRETLQDALELEGYNVRSVSNGREALGKLETTAPCLIFLDLMMPVMSGWEFLEEMKKRTDSIPIVVITAVNDDRIKEIRDRIVGVLEKPLQLEVLLDYAQRYCSRGAD